jgi:hypothetical protein
MKTYSFSAQKFTSLSDAGFNPIDYSRLKYGSKRIARKFGVELGKEFLNHLIQNQELYSQIQNKTVVISSAPYKYIPVASTILKDYFISAFNNIWAENNPSVQDLKVFRGHSYNEDYGAMTEEQRDKAIGSDSFYIDKEFIKNKILFFIDDVKITGSHERRIKKLLEDYDFDGIVVFLYYAEFVGESHPNIENQLNFAYVKDLLSINHIIRNDEFIFNTRVTKFILSANFEEFKNFINYQSKTFRNTLLTYLYGNEYHKLPEFKQNVEYLKSKI